MAGQFDQHVVRAVLRGRDQCIGGRNWVVAGDVANPPARFRAREAVQRYRGQSTAVRRMFPPRPHQRSLETMLPYR